VRDDKGDILQNSICEGERKRQQSVSHAENKQENEENSEKKHENEAD
jgi:hypothetical protein